VVDASVGIKLPTTPTADLMAQALKLAFVYNITAYDACYLALAELHGIPLLTADIRLQNSLKGSHILLLTIAEYCL